MTSISAVIPAYNASATIADAIASARAQTVPPSQIVVVDDGSTDGTRQRLESLSGPDLLVIHSENRGGAAARNHGIERARGDYIALLDADDVWRPTKLERQLSALAREQSRTPCAFSFCAVEHSNEYGESHHLPRRGPRPGESLADFMLKAGNVVQTSTLLVPRELAQRCRFTEKLRRFQDIDFILRLGAAGARPIYVEDALVEWRNTSTAPRVSAINDPSVLRDFLAQHGEALTRAQRLGLHVRSLGPQGGARGHAAWAGVVLASVCTGGLALPNALSLMLKHSLGIEAYGALRRHLRVR